MYQEHDAPDLAPVLKTLKINKKAEDFDRMMVKFFEVYDESKAKEIQESSQ
jgi:hypothetical protein